MEWVVPCPTCTCLLDQQSNGWFLLCDGWNENAGVASTGGALEVLNRKERELLVTRQQNRTVLVKKRERKGSWVSACVFGIDMKGL